MTEIFLHLVNMSITASWLIFAVIMLRLFLKKAPKWIHCLLWCMVGLRLLLPISIESEFSLIPSAETVPKGILYETSPAIDSGIDSVNRTVNLVLQESFAAYPGDSVNPLQVVVFLASYIWVLGMMVLLLYTVITYSRLKKSVGEAVRFRENIYQCENVATPFVLGVVRPRIYLSYGLQGEELTCVIAHEQAHIQRCDHLWKPLAFLILTVYWFNPLVWVAYILLCRDIEYACDEKVLAMLGTNMKKTYSTALLHCSVQGSAMRRMIAACPVAFGEVGVKSRIKSVLHYKKPAFWVIVIAIIACVVCAVCFLTNPKEEQGANTEPAASSQDASDGENLSELNELQEQLDEINSLMQEVHELQEELEVEVSQDFASSPPTMRLQEALSSLSNEYKVESGTFSWNYPSTEGSNEMVSVEACGPSSLEAVQNEEWLQLPDYDRLDYVGYIASFDVFPDRIILRELKYSGSTDMMMLSTESETVYEENYGLELKKNRIYEVIAEWDEENLEVNGFHGTAYYAFATGEIH